MKNPRIGVLNPEKYLYFDPRFRTLLDESKLFGVHECVKSIVQMDAEGLGEGETLELAQSLKEALQRYAYRACSF